MEGEIHLWRWRFTETEMPNCGKRVESSWHMSEEQAARYKDAEKIDWTLEIRRPSPSTSDFMRSQPRSTPDNTSIAPGSSSATDSSKD